MLKTDKGKPGAEEGTNVTSNVGTAIKTPNSYMTERKKEREKEWTTTKKIKTVSFGTERTESCNKNRFLTAIKIKIS